ncbi:MAG: ParA family protein [Ignavibacteriales bacterium]|nr:ParA family protein [Ignavibacteriales bacterium]
MNQIIHRTELAFLDFIPVNVRTTQHEERIMRLAENRTLLKNLIRPLLPHYDYVIIDTPPVLRGLTTVAMTAADTILIPIKSGHFSLEAIEKLIRYLDWVYEAANRNLKIEGILQTMYEPKTKVTEITDRELQTRFRRYVLRTNIPKNTHLTEASFYGKPSVLFNATSKGTLAYLELAKELIERHTPQQASPLQSNDSVRSESA